MHHVVSIRGTDRKWKKHEAGTNGRSKVANYVHVKFLCDYDANQIMILHAISNPNSISIPISMHSAILAIRPSASCQSSSCRQALCQRCSDGVVLPGALSPLGQQAQRQLQHVTLQASAIASDAVMAL